jgi:hypothetical protein
VEAYCEVRNGGFDHSNLYCMEDTRRHCAPTYYSSILRPISTVPDPQNMTQSKLTKYCARILMPRRRLDSSYHQVAYENLICGLQVFANGAQRWFNNKGPVEVVHKCIISCLYCLPDHSQWCFSRLAEKLLGRNDCVEHDEEVVKLCKLEVSAVICLFKMGICGLALTILELRLVTEIALHHEHAWLCC